MPDTGTMQIEETTAQLMYWAQQATADRDQAFSELLGNVVFRAVDDPTAAETLRRIRERAERS
jgi:hypothetical protein